MATRTDQLHSQQFMLQRVVGALAMRDPDPHSSPLRRIGGALFASVLVAGLALAAVGVYGVLRPGGGSAWRAGSAVIVEEETGARFVYRDGVLYPVLNYSSALLILGPNAAGRVRVSRAALAGVPRGAALGIPGAPDLLPTSADLVTSAWTLCSRPAAGRDSDAESVLLVGRRPAMGAEALGDRGLVVADPAGGLHLVWHQRRYSIAAPALVLAAFAWPRPAAVPVAPALLNALPAGPDLGRVPVPHGPAAAAAMSSVDGYRVGQVFVVETASGARQFGVALTGGLAEVTPVQADLLLADGANGLGGRATPMGQAQYAEARHAASLVPTGDGAPPATAPPLARPDSRAGICATFADGAARPEIGLVASPGREPGELRVPAAAAPAPPALADFVEVPPGQGVLVESLAGPDSPGGALGLVCDLGARFPLSSAEVARTLGYGGVAPVRLPAALVALLPTGPALDPATARRPA